MRISQVFRDFYESSVLLAAVSIPTIVTPILAKEIEEDDIVTTSTRILINFQHLNTVILLMSTVFVRLTQGNPAYSRLSNFATRLLFSKYGLHNVDFVLHLVTEPFVFISLNFTDHFLIVYSRHTIHTCLRCLLLQYVCEILKVHNYRTVVRYRSAVVLIQAAVLFPMTVTKEIDVDAIDKMPGGITLQTMIRFHVTVLKGMLLTIVSLCFCNADVVVYCIQPDQRNYPQSITINIILSGTFWLIFMIAFISSRLPQVWTVLVMLIILHSALLLLIRILVSYKLRPLSRDIPQNQSGLSEQKTPAIDAMEDSSKEHPSRKGEKDNEGSRRLTVYYQLAKEEAEFCSRMEKDEKEFWELVQTESPDARRILLARNEKKQTRLHDYLQQQQTKFGKSLEEIAVKG